MKCLISTGPFLNAYRKLWPICSSPFFLPHSHSLRYMISEIMSAIFSVHVDYMLYVKDYWFLRFHTPAP